LKAAAFPEHCLSFLPCYFAQLYQDICEELPIALTINERTYVEQSYIMGKLQETIGNDNFINLSLM